MATPKTVATIAGLIVALGGAAWLVRSHLSATSAAAAAPVAVLNAHEVLVAINASREHDKLVPLAIDARLTAAAQNKLADMLRRHYFDHKSPEGKSIWDALPPDKCAYGMAGENLARGFSDGDARE